MGSIIATLRAADPRRIGSVVPSHSLRMKLLAKDGDMGRIWTESGAIRAIRRKGFLNCFSTPMKRTFVVSATPLSKDGSRVRYSVGAALMLQRKLELVAGDSFCAAYRLKTRR